MARQADALEQLELFHPSSPIPGLTFAEYLDECAYNGRAFYRGWELAYTPSGEPYARRWSVQ